MDRKNHKKVFTIEDRNIQLYISSGEEREGYEYNTTTTTTTTNKRNSNVFLNFQ